MQKIMFNDKYGLNQAVLDGRKTKTRRFLTIPTNIDYDEFEMGIDSNGKVYFSAFYHGKLIRDIYPKFQIGEEVAVAQSYKDCLSASWIKYIHDVDPTVRYDRELSLCPGQDNKMFVRADLMPHRIKITNICIERLQDIKHHWTDALREGVTLDMDAPVGEQFYIEENGVKVFYLSAIGAFASLIDKTCGKGTWNRNPYVFVYDFELIK